MGLHVGSNEVESDLFGVVEAVVDGDEVSPGSGEEGRRNRGAVAAGAVDPHLAGRDVGQTLGQLVDGHVHGSSDPGLVVLVGALIVSFILFKMGMGKINEAKAAISGKRN